MNEHASAGVSVDRTVVLRCGCRAITHEDIAQIRELLRQYPQWNRQQLSIHICRLWNWRRSDGALNHRTCGDLLRLLERQGRIQLPRPKKPYARRRRVEVVESAPAEMITDLPLERLEVRPILSSERERWCRLMRQYHYLGFQSIVGESIRYVAAIGPQWVALLAWGVAAMKSRHRDGWIGWDAGLKWRRLQLGANNARFLILPGFRSRTWLPRSWGPTCGASAATGSCATGTRFCWRKPSSTSSVFKGPVTERRAG